jgi:hypothetical protein
MAELYAMVSVVPVVVSFVTLLLQCQNLAVFYGLVSFPPLKLSIDIYNWQHSMHI